MLFFFFILGYSCERLPSGIVNKLNVLVDNPLVQVSTTEGRKENSIRELFARQDVISFQLDGVKKVESPGTAYLKELAKMKVNRDQHAMVMYILLYASYNHN